LAPAQHFSQLSLGQLRNQLQATQSGLFFDLAMQRDNQLLSELNGSTRNLNSRLWMIAMTKNQSFHSRGPPRVMYARTFGITTVVAMFRLTYRRSTAAA